MLHKTLTDQLFWTAANHFGTKLEFFGRGQIVRSASYRDLLDGARSTLAWLQTLGAVPGSFVVVQTANEYRQIELFWAAVLGGIVPIITPHVTNWKNESEVKKRLLNVCNLLPRSLVIVDRQMFLTHSVKFPGDCRIIDDGDYCDDKYRTDDANIVSTTSKDVVFVQFSSGSTRSPVGIQLSNENLLSNIADIIHLLRITADDTTLSWMPLSHDMGLIGFHLVPLAAGSRQVKLEASDFVRDPRSWLRAVQTSRATLSGGPNFSLRHLTDKVGPDEAADFDLSSMRCFLNGAEPISARVLNDFLIRFQAAGFRKEAMLPCYGMAEACLGVSFAPLDAAPKVHRFDRQAMLERNLAVSTQGSGIEFVDVGAPTPSLKMRIVGENGESVANGKIGEIEISGVNVATAFIPYEAGADRFSEGGWLRTGDLGAYIDGGLIIVGRRKDLIFVNGRNVIAHDVEEATCRRLALSVGSVAVCGFSDPVDGLEKIVAFVATRSKNSQALCQSAHEAVAEIIGHRVAWVVPVARILKTTSGKLMRFAMLRDFLHGKFDDVKLGAARTSPVLQPSIDSTLAPIVELFAVLLEQPADAIDPDVSFIALGGTSVKAIELLLRLQEITNLPLDQEMLVECRTAREVATYIEARHGSYDANRQFDDNTHQTGPKCRDYETGTL
ncbi:non-ribosomal peptide synthetase [Methylosinus sp. Sm6]|uniref:non-ribosomal peptide synthetase n=1 Tax=Methylosinus sp. Sm6 TaxID=2866948 RepID=UPI001C9913C8|nr:non-ribosomal peptide synthetase [Methylosinus sp. Sm6]MBY6244042.1 non-ribosomal peptide synthetase [Methylosinus sp. Sm6]